MSEPLEATGDPWIDAYLTFRRAWLDGATESELTDLANERRRSLPHPAPSVPAALFIHRDILITSQQNALPRQLVTALWVPDGAGLWVPDGACAAWCGAGRAQAPPGPDRGPAQRGAHAGRGRLA